MTEQIAVATRQCRCRLTGLNRYGDLAGTLSVANSSYTYDALGRLTNLTHQRGVTTLASYGLVYDAANRITQSSGTDGVQDYTYDSTNQLTGANHTTQADEAYSYDANGNRTNVGYGTGTNNQLLTDGIYNYQYDDEGNRTKRVEISTGKVTEYVWDYRNRLAGVLFKDAVGVVTKTIEYLYDVNDRRIGKKIDGVTTERYVLDRNQISLVFDGAGNQTHRYLYGTGVDQILADETPTAMVWALADNQGTVKDLIDNAGNAVSHINYDSFGRIVSQTGGVDFRYGYTGREQDAETGLDYYRARYYDSANGRFISEDLIGFGAGDSNLTRYVGNSPTNWVDPSGLDGVSIWPEVNPLDILIPAGAALKALFGSGFDRATRGGFLDAGGVSDGTVPNGIKKKIRTEPGKFDPNYGRDNKPTISFSPVHIRAKGSRFYLPTHTTFPDTGDCSIGGKLPPHTGHGLKENHFIRYLSSEWDPFNPNAIWNNSVNLHDLSNAANQIRPNTNGLTQAGRALTKHANNQRGTSPFPKLKGNNTKINQVAAEQVADIITDPDAVFVRLGGGGVEVRVPDGRGARWDSNGSFNTFVD
jgi:RHS repeat-associated protein